MFLKNNKIKKQIASLLFASAMAVTSFSGFDVNAFAASNTYESVPTPKASLSVSSFKVSKANGANITDTITLTAKAKGGSGNYEYRFGTNYNGKDYYNSYSAGYSSSASVTTSVYNLAIDNTQPSGYAVITGINKLFVDVKDTSSGKVVRKTIDNYYVDGLQIESLTATPKNGAFKVGEQITLNVDIKNEASYRYNPRTFSYSTDMGKTYTVINNYAGGYYNCSFTPNKAGNYKIKYSISDFIGQKAERVIDITVTGNEAVVYYDNSSWSNANIHYCVDNGSWTNVPGVKMQSSDKSGYKWKYIIDLGSQNGATVCFNNGNNSWDSNNGSNYRVGKGTYGIKNGKLVTLSGGSSSIAANMEFIGGVGSKSAKITMVNGKAPYTIEYSSYKDGELQHSGSTTASTDYANISFSMYYEGLYRVDAKVKDADGKECTISGDFDFPGLIINLTPDKQEYKVGEEVTVTCTTENFYYYKFPPTTYWYVTKDGQNVSYTVSGSSIKFRPTQAGTYTIKYDIPEYQLGAVSKTITINVKNDNKVVVYYCHSGFSNAYIHYGINGSWTNAPGVKMQSSNNPKYTWMYVIDLGDADSVQVCFNDGNGTWDSNNGANYTLSAGEYRVVYGRIYNA